MKVELTNITPNAELHCEKAARDCYDSISKMKDPNKVSNLVKACTVSDHLTINGHAMATFRISGVSRALMAQITRHRTACFCLSGDTEINRFTETNRKLPYTIKQIYEMWNDSKKKRLINMLRIRSMDESGSIVKSKIKDVFYSGKKEVYEITTKLGYKIKASKDHIFFNKNGEIQLKDIKINDKILVNGVELYQDKDWFYDMYVNKGYNTTQISKICGIAKCTARKWKKIHKIKSINKYKKREVWNKGLTKENDERLLNISKIHKKNPVKTMLGKRGSLNPNWKGEDITKAGGYSRMHRYFERTGQCSMCFDKSKEVHHIDENPKNNKVENLLELCSPCHKLIHRGLRVKKITQDTVTSIEKIGIEDTYDLEMYSPNHNFIANGVLVHNSVRSQRYVKEDQFEYVIPKCATEDDKKEYAKDMKTIQDMYNKWISRGWKAEDSRSVLPNSCATVINMSMSFEGWLHFLRRRMDSHAQIEIRELAFEIYKELNKNCPRIFNQATIEAPRKLKIDWDFK